MNNTDKVKKWVEETTEKLGLNVSSVEIEIGSVYVIRIQMDDGNLLIGQNGDNLHALNHLLRRFVEKNFGNDNTSKYVIDVNDYRKKAEDRIRGVAKMLGERALTFKSEVAMEPTGSFERRVVHSFFENHPHITTTSKGFGKDRHVVIRFVEEKVSPSEMVVGLNSD